MKPITLFLSLIFLLSFTSSNENAFSKKLRKKYAFIPSGEVMIDNVKKTVNGFYMMKTEVSNLDYKEFLAFLKTKGEEEKSEICKIHSEGWKEKSFEEVYADHPAYENYPVVNITAEAAQLYCEFLKHVLNRSGEIKGYKIAECRLPYRAEWIMAARAGRMFVPYPWGGYYLRDSKGQILANFNRIGEGNITYDYENKTYKIVEDSINSHAMIPAPIFSFFPNDFGLYHMSGNVAEMVAEKGIAVGGGWNSTGYDIRVESTMPFEGYSPEVGFRPLLILEKE